MKKILILLIIISSISCTKKDTQFLSSEEIKQNEYIVNYVSVFRKYAQSIEHDEWNLSNPLIKQQWLQAKEEKHMLKFKRNLKNSTGKSFLEAETEVLQAYANVKTNLLIPKKITPEQFKQAVSLLIKEQNTNERNEINKYRK